LGVDHCAKSETPNVRQFLERTIRCSENRVKVPKRQAAAEAPVRGVEAGAPPLAVRIERSAEVEKHCANKGG
jgi:hypothetical protein